MNWASGGDRENGFEGIYRKHYARIYRYFRSCKVSDDESHDLAQDTFQRFYEHMHQFRGDSEAIWSFLKKIAHNILLNRIRSRATAKRKATIVEIDDPEVGFDLAAPAEPDLAEQEHEAVRQDQLRRSITELSEAQQQVLTLWIEDLTYIQIASALRISVDAVKSRLRDAKRHLRGQLGDDR
jgi:RNA polymerase sigma-70 factor, ECF subfamily